MTKVAAALQRSFAPAVKLARSGT